MLVETRPIGGRTRQEPERYSAIRLFPRRWSRAERETVFPEADYCQPPTPCLAEGGWQPEFSRRREDAGRQNATAVPVELEMTSREVTVSAANVRTLRYAGRAPERSARVTIDLAPTATAYSGTLADRRLLLSISVAISRPRRPPAS